MDPCQRPGEDEIIEVVRAEWCKSSDILNNNAAGYYIWQTGKQRERLC